MNIFSNSVESNFYTFKDIFHAVLFQNIDKHSDMLYRRISAYSGHPYDNINYAIVRVDTIKSTVFGCADTIVGCYVKNRYDNEWRDLGSLIRKEDLNSYFEKIKLSNLDVIKSNFSKKDKPVAEESSDDLKIPSLDWETRIKWLEKNQLELRSDIKELGRIIDMFIEKDNIRKNIIDMQNRFDKIAIELDNKF